MLSIDYAQHLFARTHRNSYTYTEESNIKDTYSSLFGRALRETHCKDCLRDALIEIIVELKKINKMANSKYALKEAYGIYHDGVYYNTYTLTDEIAEAWLSAHPDERWRFDIVEKAKAPSSAKKSETGVEES